MAGDVRVEVLDDGSVRKYLPVSWNTRQRPTYGMWLKFLESRKAAVSFTDGERVDRDGNTVPRFGIDPITRKQHGSSNGQIASAVVDEDGLFTGEVVVPCICCGMVLAVSQMSRIRIGGLVRFPEEEQTGPDEVTVSVVVRPVTRLGMGCPVCRDRYHRELNLTEAENRSREITNKMTAQLSELVRITERLPQPLPTAGGRCPHGLPRADFCAVCLRNRGAKREQAPEVGRILPMKVAWIDVFDTTIVPKSSWMLS